MHLQQRINETEQPRDAAAVQFDELAPTGADALPKDWIGEKLAQTLRQIVRIGDFDGSASLQQ
jgi:hypothetical protein